MATVTDFFFLKLQKKSFEKIFFILSKAEHAFKSKQSTQPPLESTKSIFYHFLPLVQWHFNKIQLHNRPVAVSLNMHLQFPTHSSRATKPESIYQIAAIAIRVLCCDTSPPLPECDNVLCKWIVQILANMPEITKWTLSDGDLWDCERNCSAMGRGQGGGGGVGGSRSSPSVLFLQWTDLHRDGERSQLRLMLLNTYKCPCQTHVHLTRRKEASRGSLWILLTSEKREKKNANAPYSIEPCLSSICFTY